MIDTTEMVPGRIYIIEKHPWGKCRGCGKILRLDRWCGSLHFCSIDTDPHTDQRTQAMKNEQLSRSLEDAPK